MAGLTPVVFVLWPAQAGEGIEGKQWRIGAVGQLSCLQAHFGW